MPKRANPSGGKMLGISEDGTGGAVVSVGNSHIWLTNRQQMADLFAVMSGVPRQGDFERDRDGIRCGPVTVVLANFQAARVRERLEELVTRPD